MFNLMAKEDTHGLLLYIVLSRGGLTTIGGTITFDNGDTSERITKTLTPPPPGTGGTDGSKWSLLLGTWQSNDGKLEYKFRDVSGFLGGKIVTVTGSPPYEQWTAFFFAAETITSNTISDPTASFEFVLSDNNQTLTVSNFRLREAKASHQPGPLNFNGVLRKQP